MKQYAVYDEASKTWQIVCDVANHTIKTELINPELAEAENIPQPFDNDAVEISLIGLAEGQNSMLGKLKIIYDFNNNYWVIKQVAEDDIIIDTAVWKTAAIIPLVAEDD